MRPLFATPPADDPRLADCHFYHTTEIPGHGVIDGEWDLRPAVEAYLGAVRFAGRSVLDVGAATGFLSFHVEQAGARVISYDLSPSDEWDIVPFAGLDPVAQADTRKAHIRAINNGYWLCHRARGSAARMAHGTVYAMDAALGPVDVSVFGSLLLHLRDPFLALHNALRITRETVVVAEILPGAHILSRWLAPLLGRSLQFKPRFARNGPWETWWHLPPRTVVEFLGILGFEKSSVTYHHQLYKGRRMPMYTVVAQRTKPTAPLKREAAYPPP